MKQPIIVVGTGAVAAEITSYIEDTSLGDRFQIKGYLESPQYIEAFYKHYDLRAPILGNADDYVVESGDRFVLGIANPTIRKEKITMLQAKGAQFVNLVHPTAIVARTARMGEGNVIDPYCMLGPNAVLGNFNLLTSGSIVSHDCTVGNNNAFSTALLCGHVQMGNDNTMGIRSTVIPHITIGDRNTIQAGMVVDRNIGNDATVFHRFKEKIIAIAKE